MSFFNLTQLGPQNPIKTSTLAENKSEEHKAATINKTGTLVQQQQHTVATNDERSLDSLPTFRAMMYSNPSLSSPYRGSHKQLSEMRTKHQRHSQGPMDLYAYPMTTSQKYGWWLKFGSTTWSQGERHVHVNSEMTRFVDEMSATNKDFSLF